MWTSCVMKILLRNAWVRVGQKVGIDAHMLARSTSRAARMMLLGPYQVGSRTGYVPALLATMVWRRHMLRRFTLFGFSC